MDDSIIKALEALGLSAERIARLAELITGVKDRVRSEGLVTRKKAPVVIGKQPKPRRTLRVTYRPKGTGPTVAQEIARLETRLTREIPYWQRRSYEARLDGLLRTGKTYQESASETLAAIDRERGRRKKVT